MIVKDTHLIGKQVELIFMKGEPKMEKGLKGVIVFIDDMNHYHVKWDNGSGLSLLPKEDKFNILN